MSPPVWVAVSELSAVSYESAPAPCKHPGARSASWSLLLQFPHEDVGELGRALGEQRNRAGWRRLKHVGVLEQSLPVESHRHRAAFRRDLEAVPLPGRLCALGPSRYEGPGAAFGPKLAANGIVRNDQRDSALVAAAHQDTGRAPSLLLARQTDIGDKFEVTVGLLRKQV